MYSEIPNQRVPQARKTKQWAIDTMEAYFSIAEDGRTYRKEELRKLYDYYNGVIYDDDYQYVVQPYGKLLQETFLFLLPKFLLVQRYYDT